MTQQWYVVQDDGEEDGPFTSVALKAIADRGEIQPSTRIRREEDSETHPASAVRGLFPAPAGDTGAGETPQRGSRAGRRVRAATLGGTRKVRNAGRWLLVVGVLMAVAGTVVGMGEKDASETLLAALDRRDDDAIIRYEGEERVVSVLRDEIEFGVLFVFGIHYLLAAAMVVLFFWARSAPLPALVTGLGLYLALVGLAAIGDPTTLYKGWLLKVLVIGSLSTGTLAAMRLKRLEAAG